MARCHPPVSQPTSPTPSFESGWEALCRTADAVRAEPEPALRLRRHHGRALLTGAMLGATVFAGSHLHAPPAAADGTADSDLFTLTNQDRTSNGVAALTSSSTLSAIGEAAPYSGCGGAGTIYGRAQDMINRNYFSHEIPPCNQYVFSMMSAFGVGYRSAGENIGWVSGESDGGAASSWINTAFMNSADHKANILNPNYTELGIGSATTAAGQSWTGAGSSVQNVWIFAEEFAQVGSPATPPPTPPPTPATSTPPPASPARSAATPVPTPVPTPTPTPIPTPTPTLSPTPTPTATPSPTPVGLTLPAYEDGGQGLSGQGLSAQGLIANTIESTLEAFLFD